MWNWFPPYALLSTLAIIVKVGMLFRFRSELSSYNHWFKLTFAAFLWLNIYELISFYYPRADRIAYLLIVSYYVCAFIGLGTVVGIAVSTSGRMTPRKRWSVIGAISIGVVSTLTPGYILDGVQHIGFTLTRVPGDHYWIFQSILLLFVATSLWYLCVGSLDRSDIQRSRRCKALLISFTPIFLVIPLVLGLMHVGIPVTGTIFGSFAILVFLMTLMATETEVIRNGRSPQGDQKVVRFLTSIPSTSEFDVASRLRHAVAPDYSNDLEKAVANFERTLIQETLAMCNGNKSSAAKLLGISRTTLRRKLKSYAEG